MTCFAEILTEVSFGSRLLRTSFEHARLRELATRSPGEYVLFDHTMRETVEKVSSPNLSS